MDRKIILLCAGAIPLGLAGGYAWSTLSSPAAHAAAPAKARFAPLPASPEERPLEPDRLWASRADPVLVRAAPAASSPAAPDRTVHYSGCNEVRAAGRAPLYADQPGYRIEMDGDGDGIACEPYRRG